IFVRQARSAGAPSLIIAAYRLTFAAALLAPYTLMRHRSDLARLSRRAWRAALVSGAFLGLHFAAWIASLDFTTIAASIVLVTTSPLWVALAAAVFLREPLTRPVVIGLALALAGGLIITADASGCVEGSLCNEPLLGDALALAGAIAIAVYFLLGRRLRRSLPLAPYVFLVYSTSAVTLLIAAMVAGLSFTGQPAPYSAGALGWIALLAIGPQLIGHSSLNYALKYLPTPFVAMATLGEPIGSTILAFVVLHEQPSLATWIGGALILAGIAAASHASGAP
ncbi:MAG TPA: DMT family transporter, partial [Anaerolineae bacterium]|nr:DMT family transporter [Anaerolineae bacterium]